MNRRALNRLLLLTAGFLFFLAGLWTLRSFRKTDREYKLLSAIMEGNEARVRSLLSEGVSPNATFGTENERVTLVALARRRGHARIEKMLVAAGARD